MNAETQTIITHHTYYSIAAGIIPIPLLDIAAVTAIQLDMARQLSNYYNLEWSENSGKVVIGALTGGLGARIGAEAIKLIPGIGTVIGGLAMSGMSGASTYALGKVLDSHFSRGLDVDDINPDEYKAAYEAAYEEGKTISREAAKKQKDNLKRIAELEVLRSRGSLTQEEFQLIRDRIMKG